MRFIPAVSLVRIQLPLPIWPDGQEVKTPPFHGGIGGSIPPRVTMHHWGSRCTNLCSGFFVSCNRNRGRVFHSHRTVCGKPGPFFAEDPGGVEEGNGGSARRRPILRPQGFTGSRFDGGSGGGPPPPRCRSGRTPRCSNCRGPRRMPRWRARCNGQKRRPPRAAPRGRYRSPPRH